jgi:hypothetical protein
MPGLINFLINTATQISGVTSMFGALVMAIIAAALWAWSWHGRMRAEGKPGVEPLHLISWGLVGAFVSAGVALGGFIWQINRASTQEQAATSVVTDQKNGQSVPNQPISTHKKSYFPAEKVEIGNLISQISTHINSEALRAADMQWIRGIQTDRNNSQIEELLKDIDETRSLTITLSRAAWDDLVRNNAKFSKELTAIVGESGGNSPLARFQVALNSYHTNVTYYKSRLDHMDFNDKAWIADKIFNREAQDSVRMAADNFKNWITECNARIEEQRTILAEER